VLGGTGFVGRTLCAQLIAAGFAVRVGSRNRQRHRNLLVLPGLQLIQADIHDFEQLRRLFSGVDVVVNLVGILNERGHDGSGFRRAHVELVETIIRSCHETGVRRLLHMSALKANAERGPSHYLRSKGQAEQLIRSAAAGIDFTIFRPSVIFGPDDGFLNRFARILRAVPVLPLAQLEARFAPVYVDDVAQAMLRALDTSHSHGETYELCGPQIYSLREILNFLKRELGLRRAIVGLPLALGHIQAWLADYLIPGKPFSIDNLKSMTVANVCSDNGFARLKLEPRQMSLIASQYLCRNPGLLTKLRQRS
jgi:NADH dehydrogenase